ncbi:MAG: class I SAM-dependent methyltransferase [Clostridiales Family XIII bacterium]|jgi:tRNA A22 N-methylase|nr:class I SAM-dependent methyltransferase [Clostridiales Family XIII bacterium]
MASGKKLSDRLRLIADYAIPEQSVATSIYEPILIDVGTDHGLLPRKLLDEGKLSRAILTDVVDGPLSMAKNNLDADLYGDRIELRLGDGLQPLNHAEGDVVVIAGMGGELITHILETDIVKTKSFPRYILQPRNASDILRRFLYDNDFFIIDEGLVLERGKICEVIHCAVREYTTITDVRVTDTAINANNYCDDCGNIDVGEERMVLTGRRYKHDDTCLTDFQITNIHMAQRPQLLKTFIKSKISSLSKARDNILSHARGNQAERLEIMDCEIEEFKRRIACL